MTTIAPEPTAETKRCSKCGETKPTTKFARKTAAKDGLQDWCKLCCKTKPASEPAKFDTVTNFDENKAIAKQFIRDHLAEHGEACDLYFSHKIRYDHPTVSGEMVTRAINEMLRKGELKLTRFEIADVARLNFYTMAQQRATTVRR